MPVHEDSDPRPTVERLATSGFIDAGTANWLLTWFDRLATRFDREAPNVLLHGDLAPQNLLVDQEGRYCALIDWGDAAWGPAGAEFAKLRLEHVAELLPGYGPAGPGELEAAALWFHLSWGLSNLTGPPQQNQRHWTAPPASRLLGVLRFFAGNAPSPWTLLNSPPSDSDRPGFCP